MRDAASRLRIIAVQLHPAFVLDRVEQSVCEPRGFTVAV